MWRLTKLSDPGWEKSFESYRDLYMELANWNCEACLNSWVRLEDTACSAEFMVEDSRLRDD